MTKTMIHAVASGLSVPLANPGYYQSDGMTLLAGQTVELSEAQVEETKNRYGESWLDLDEDAQVARWGRVMFRHGPAPEGQVIGEDDSSVMMRKFYAALAKANRISDPDDRDAAVAEARRKYGNHAKLNGQPQSIRFPGAEL